MDNGVSTDIVHGPAVARQRRPADARRWLLWWIVVALLIVSCDRAVEVTATGASASVPRGDSARAAGGMPEGGSLLAASPSVSPPALRIDAAVDGSWHEGSFEALGGVPIRVRVWGGAAATLAQQLARLQARVAELEAQLSRYRTGSDVQRLNAAAGQQVAIRPHTRRVLARALFWARRSSGAFDPTVGPVLAVWRAAARRQRWPDDAVLRRAVASVGYRRVSLDDAGAAVGGDVQLDLGGIAKGYIADRLARALQDEGVTRARVDVGGDLRVFDRRARPSEFRIGIRHPSGSGVLATVAVTGGGIATSGCYERAVVVAGRTVCHVVDPRTGQPVDSGRSATVVASAGVDADALATALLALGAGEGLRLVESLAGVEALVAERSSGGGGLDGGTDAGLNVAVSSGLRERITFAQGR